MKGKRFLTLFACLCFLLVFTTQDIRAMDVDVPGPHASIQAAIDEAFASGGGTVRVAAGIYDSNTQSFPIYMKDGVQLIGEGADVCTLLANGTTSVIICIDVGETSRIEGFEITGGDASSGSAIYIYRSALTITDNIISGNGTLGEWGSFNTDLGTIYCRESSPTISNNIITGNLAQYGGGILCEYPDISNNNPIITENVISGNDTRHGGAIYFYRCSPAIISNVITGNTALWGAGIYCRNYYYYAPLPTIVNNIIAGNAASGYGGGIYCYFSSPATITNNTIADNSASTGGGIRWRYHGLTTMTNNIITGNTASLFGGGIYGDSPNLSNVTYNDVWGNSPDNYYPDVYYPENPPGNISDDPMFRDPAIGDYHLQRGSPCIDVGNNSAPGLPLTDFEGDDRIIGSVVDLGADERTNTPPDADAGSDQTVSAGSDCQAVVALDGSGSSDADGDTLEYTWTGPFGDVTGSNPTVKLGVGTHTITLRVSDGIAEAIDEVVITVQDVTPPSFDSLVATPNTLWPPNHKMIPVVVSASVSDYCDPNPSVQIINVSSNEPDNAKGDGNIAPDWEVTGDLTVNLRAERSGKGTGRVYTITVRCSDSAENFSDRQVIVTVPHDQGNKTQSNNANKGKKPEKIKK